MDTTKTPPARTFARFDVEEPPSGLHPTSVGSRSNPRHELPRITVHEHEGSASDNPPEVAEIFPDGGTRSWLVVLGSFLLLMASYGLMNSVGVLQSYLETHQLASYSSQEVGWILGVFMFMTLGLGVFVGPLFDTYGPRELVIAGWGLYVVGLFLTAECTRYWHFMLCFGVLAGVGAALVSMVSLSCVPHWFQLRAGVALGTALAGGGLGGVVFPFILKAAFANVGFRWGMRILGFVLLVFCGLGSFLLKSRLPRRKFKTAIDIRCFKDWRFTLLTLGTFCLELEVFALLGLYPTYVVKQGFGTSSSVYLLVVLNVLSCIGRLVAGRVADRFGRLNILIGLIMAGIICVFAILYPFSHRLPALYVFSVLYGLCSGSFISLAPVCIRQVSPAKEIGTRFGTCYCLVSFATLICIPIGGEMLERVGSHNVVVWLGCLLILGTLLFLTARWACLDYKWNWNIKI